MPQNIAPPSTRPHDAERRFKHQLRDVDSREFSFLRGGRVFGVASAVPHHQPQRRDANTGHHLQHQGGWVLTIARREGGTINRV